MKHSNKISLTIGIPAYNEGKNIYSLLKAIKSQVGNNYMLRQIILVLDGSTDDTLVEAKRTKMNILQIHQFPNRHGKSKALQFIQANTNTDMLLLFDADVEIKDNYFIDKLVEPIVLKKADLTSAKVVPKKSSIFFTKMLYVSNQFKQSIYEAWDKGNNLYTCHGRAICLSRNLYPKIAYEGVVADDALSFITAKHLGLNYMFVKDAKVFYKLPQTYKDHSKQSIRFLQREKQFSKYFDTKLVKKLYRIPYGILIPVTLKYFFNKPVNMSIYIVLFLYLKISSYFRKTNSSKWSVAESSKIW